MPIVFFLIGQGRRLTRFPGVNDRRVKGEYRVNFYKNHLLRISGPNQNQKSLSV